MAYKLIIADDKSIILDGLTKLVDWTSLGFEIAGTFSDGQGVIDFVERNDVDVVLTDIKMPICSGLEVARYIHDKNLAVFVVLISAYKDFKLAREAISYNVNHYLLKPTKLDEITSVFNEIKQQLDDEKKKETFLQVSSEDTEINAIMQRHFFTDLFWGIICESEEAKKRAHDARYDYNVLKCPVAFLSLKMDFEEESSGEIQQIKEYFNASEIPVYEKGVAVGRVYLICTINKIFYYAATFNMHIPLNEIRDKLNTFFDRKCEEIRLLFGYKVIIDNNDVYENIEKFLIASNLEEENEVCGSTFKEVILKHHEDIVIDEYIRQIAQYINEMEKDFAIKMFKRLIGNYTTLPAGSLKIFITGLFVYILDSIGRKKLLQSEEFSYKFEKTNEKAKIIDVAEKLILKLVDEKKNHESQTKNIIIQQAKEYIGENYSNDIGLDEVSKHVYLSPTYFSRFFKQEMDVNFTEYIKQLRVKKAIELMSQIQYKIYDISRIVGYNNIRYFYKVFKQITGYTPTEYRNMHWKEEY